MRAARWGRWGRRFRLPTIFSFIALALCVLGSLAVSAKDEPLPNGRGSDLSRAGSSPSRDSDPSHDRKGVVVPAFPSPIEMAISANGSRLYVVCEGTNEVIEVDPVAGAVLRRVRVGQHPKSISLSADGRFLYVANS